MELLPIDIIDKIVRYNTHPMATMFTNELGGFIDEHFDQEWNPYNCRYENIDSYQSFGDHFFHGTSSPFPDKHRVLTPITRSFYIYNEYWRDYEKLYKHRYGKEFIENLIKYV